MKPFQPAMAEAMPLASPTDRLNAVPLAADQLRTALERLAALPAALQSAPAAQAKALQAYAEEEALIDACASAALHARATALAKWTAAHDPDRQSDAQAVLEAAARFPLSDGAAGIQFEAAGFQEMILFIEELPF